MLTVNIQLIDEEGEVLKETSVQVENEHAMDTMIALINGASHDDDSPGQVVTPLPPQKTHSAAGIVTPKPPTQVKRELADRLKEMPESLLPDDPTELGT